MCVQPVNCVVKVSEHDHDFSQMFPPFQSCASQSKSEIVNYLNAVSIIEREREREGEGGW